MSNLVSPKKIEEIVGTHRRKTMHIGRAVSAERQVYILHSKGCIDTVDDLRDCPFSRALDKGIDEQLWTPWQDKAVVLRIARARLAPARTVPGARR